MTQERVIFTQRDKATGYQYPLSSTLLTATSQGAAQTLGTIRSGSVGKVRRLVVVNQSGSAETLNVHFIPSSGTIGAANREISAISITAGEHKDLTDLIGGLYAENTQIKAHASTSGALLVSGYVEGIL